MHALISTLDGLNDEQVSILWQMLANRCDLSGRSRIALPVFSWHGAESYQLQMLEPLLADWASHTGLFQVRTNGLGIFTGEKPIIYLHLVATDRVEYYHRQIWQNIQATPTFEPSPYYAPHTWLPHIPLGIEDVIDSKLGCAISQLAFQPYDWSIWVDNLTIAAYKPEQSGEMIKQFRPGIENGN